MLVSSESINAPAAVTLAVSVTSAEASTVSNLAPSAATLRLFTVLKLTSDVVLTTWFSVLTAVMLVSSLSITAPAAVTLAVSVTSAPASMPSSLVPSTDTSRPSIVALTGTVILPLTETFPSKLGLSLSAFVALAVAILLNSVSNSVPLTILLGSPGFNVSLEAKSVVLV